MALSSAMDTHPNYEQAQIEDFDPIRVLICEDDPVTLKIVEKRVKSAGFDVRTAVDGRKGLEQYHQFKPQLILSDWMMPELDGVQFCARVRELEETQSTYFILLTAKDGKEEKVQAFDSGADEYLVKPIDGKELTARLGAAERLIRTQQALAKSYADLTEANKRIEDEIQEISKIQISMLPQELPYCKGYKFASHYKPSTECSGDFYDLMVTPNGRMGIVMGDVSGHGAPAMVAMTMVNTFMHLYYEQFDEPAKLLYHVNNQMFQHLPTGQYCTLFYGHLDVYSGKLEYCSGGHPAPLIYDKNTKQCHFLPDCEGFPIKLVAPNMEYMNHEANLEQGQTLIAYTDGLLEAFNAEGVMYGQDRFEQDVAAINGETPEEIIDGILEKLNAFTGGTALEDDLSLLAISRR